MQVIHLDYPLKHIEKKAAVAAIGYFDGLHLGHQGVIRKAIERSKAINLASALITFNPHPREVLKKDEITSYITPLDDKLAVLEQLGIDLVYVIQFTWEFSQITPYQFVREVLLPLGIAEAVVGFDFRFGKGGLGTPTTLQEAGDGELDVHVIKPILNENMKISSSLIREQLMLGNIERVNDYLARSFIIRGTVIHGSKRGREIGFPTANIALNDRYFLPKHGVYGVRVNIGSAKLFGVMNIGVKPTFEHGTSRVSLEVHLLDFASDLYDQELAIEVLFYIRGEQKFAGIEQLKEQISNDIMFAKQKFICYTI